MSPLEPLSVANTKNGHSSPCHATLSSCTSPPQSLPPNSCNHDRKKNLKLPRHRQGVKAGSRQSKREIRTLTNALTTSMGLPHLLSGKLGYGQTPQPQAPTRARGVRLVPEHIATGGALLGQRLTTPCSWCINKGHLASHGL